MISSIRPGLSCLMYSVIFAPSSWKIPVVSPLASRRSEEHTSELQSRPHLVCRLLLAKKKKIEHRFKPALSGRRLLIVTALIELHRFQPTSSTASLPLLHVFTNSSITLVVARHAYSVI